MKKKSCNICKKIFPSTSEYFHIESRKADGLRESCKTCRRAYLKEWGSSERVKKHKTEYRKRNREHIREYKKLWEQNRANTHPEYRIRKSLRTRIYHAIKNSYKSDKTMSLIGCSLEYFIAYLESKFQDGMTLENYGEWHIDHIRPCASFDLTDPDQQRQCFHYTNLQPLWAKDNILKGDRY